MISWWDLVYKVITKSPALVKKGIIVTGLKPATWADQTALPTAEIMKIVITVGLGHRFTSDSKLN